MYSIKLTSRAKRELKTLKKVEEEEIDTALKEIKENPFVSKPLSLELEGQYTFKLGVYKIVYKINEKDKIVTIITAGHRATVYK